MATKKSKATASNKAVKTVVKGITEAVVKSGAGTARKPHSANKEAAAAIPPPRKGKPVVAIDSAAPEVVELQKLVDAGKKPVEPIKAVEPVAAPAAPAAAGPVAVPAAEKKVPKDRSAAAKQAWVTIRANRAAAAAAKAS